MKIEKREVEEKCIILTKEEHEAIKTTIDVLVNLSNNSFHFYDDDDMFYCDEDFDISLSMLEQLLLCNEVIIEKEKE